MITPEEMEILNDFYRKSELYNAGHDEHKPNLTPEQRRIVDSIGGRYLSEKVKDYFKRQEA